MAVIISAKTNLGRITSADYSESIVKFTYAYEANENNIDTKTFHHRTGTPKPANDYDYDDLDRLTGIEYLTNQADVESFTMDTLGNRTGDQTLRGDSTVDFTIDSATNRYSSVGGNPISHDDAGNTTTDKDSYTYQYDYENRIVKIEDSSSSDVAEYAYDALGRRIKVIDSKAATTTLYYYNPQWQVLAEYNGAGAQQRYFIYGNYIDEPLIMHRESDSEDYYYAQDHLYSVVALIDDGGSVVERYEYDAYGTAHIMDAGYNTRTVSSYGNPYMFTSRRLDVLDNGNLLSQYSRNRIYDTYTARFLQPDPAGYVDGMNLYEYVGSQPVERGDPSGLLWLIARNQHLKARAEVWFAPATINDLALRIGLNGGEFKEWVTASGSIKTENGMKKLETLNPSERICPGEHVEVPNTVLAYWAGVGKGWGKAAVGWQRDIDYLAALGFDVYEREGWTGQEFEENLKLGTKEKVLHGLFAWGHGAGPSLFSPPVVFITDNGEWEKASDAAGRRTWETRWDDWPMSLKYKLALGILNFCGGHRAETNNFSGNAIFWGGPDLMWPLIDSTRVENVIEPGDQATKGIP